MTEIFRIIGKNDIHFDAGATSNYLFTQGKPPRKLSTILTRQEVLAVLPRLPLGVRPMALKHGLSVITMELNIHGFADAGAGITGDMDMEAKEHALIETLVETDVFFSNGGTMGTKAELQVKSDGASEVSFKSVFFAVLDELDARDVLGAVIKSHSMYGLRLTLYCEENWRPGTFNHLFNGGFEFWDRVPYGGAGADTEPDGWIDTEDPNITGTNNREPATVQQGSYALRLEVTNSVGAGSKGVLQDILPYLIPGVTYTLIVWLRNTTITNGLVQIIAWGDISGSFVAYNNGAANADYTRYTVAFTPSTADTFFNVRTTIYALGANCSGTAYFDGMMVVRGTVIPDDFIEWHPNPGIRIGPDLLSNAGFEEWPADVTDNEPDCWENHESIIGGTHTNNQESIEVLQGCHALEIQVGGISNGDEKGVEQEISARLVADREYVLIVWIKNPVAIVNGDLHVEAYGSVSFSLGIAYHDRTAHLSYTRYACTFTPAAGDIAGTVHIYAYIVADADFCTGIVYIDKMMVIEASVYNGHSFAPEEWTGCGYVWNHLDKACGPAPPENECGHVNYLNIADLRGDVDGRPRIEMQSLYANSYGPGELTVARRTDPCLPCQFVHFLEAEDATTQTRWGDVVNNDRSGCDEVENTGADLDGHIIWDYTTLGYDLACQKGRFRVLGAVYVDYDGVADENIKFRLTHGPAAYQQSRWLQPLIDSTWHWLDFGVFEVTGQFWGDELPSTLYWRVDYLKEANDDVALDFLLLLPEDESMLRIPLGEYLLATNEDVLWDDTFDFILAMKRNTADAFVWHPPIQAEPLALKPEEQNRLIFAIGHWISDTFPYKGCFVHEYNGEHMLVSLKYLPQFVSPLE